MGFFKKKLLLTSIHGVDAIIHVIEIIRIGLILLVIQHLILIADVVKHFQAYSRAAFRINKCVDIKLNIGLDKLLG